ncbi:MAG: prolipoprotein diacylglyceryl transferase [Deltaproteobacteria bacterium]|nr:prolipoprotein diacylglyceryl transferase [Deltaproteobacteria bacterium]
MIPVLFKIPLPFSIFGFDAIPINSYGLLLVLGFFNAFFLVRREFRERGIDEEFASTVITLGMFSAIIGSRVFHVFEHLGAYKGANFWKIFSGSGFSWYGGFVFAAIAILWAAHRRGIRWTDMVDTTAPAIAIGYGFGRVGCFLAGDGCYGQPCASLDLHWPVPFCMAFPKGAVATKVAVINTPIFELIGAIALFAYLQYIRSRVKTPTYVFAQMVIIHAVMRFLVEFIRVNPKLALGLSQAQWVSIAGLAIGGFLLWYGPHIKVPEPEPAKKKKKKQDG